MALRGGHVIKRKTRNGHVWQITIALPQCTEKLYS